MSKDSLTNDIAQALSETMADLQSEAAYWQSRAMAAEARLESYANQINNEAAVYQQGAEQAACDIIEAALHYLPPAPQVSKREVDIAMHNSLEDALSYAKPGAIIPLPKPQPQKKEVIA